MIKIFTTADNHIGLTYSRHKNSSLLAAKRISAFERMVGAANVEECSLFVIAGDLFDRISGAAKKDIKALTDILSRFNGPVIVLPGNHDYYDNDVKIWQIFNEFAKDIDNILLLTEHRPYEISAMGEEIIIYPALCRSKHSEPGENNLGWIKREDIQKSEAYRIGIAHGAVEGESLDKEGTYFLMKRSELEDIPVDVWLIGHTHVPFPKTLTDEFMTTDEKIFNPGTHIQTDVACNTVGQCFIIRIDDNKTVSARRFVSGDIGFYRKNIFLTAGNMRQILNNELSGIDDNSVVDIILSGAVNDEEYEERTKILDSNLSRFIEGTFDDTELGRLISEEIIDSEFPETSFSAKLLKALMDEPKEAQLVYDMLKALEEEK